jgi:hypothetical protein
MIRPMVLLATVTLANNQCFQFRETHFRVLSLISGTDCFHAKNSSDCAASLFLWPCLGLGRSFGGQEGREPAFFRPSHVYTVESTMGSSGERALLGRQLCCCNITCVHNQHWRRPPRYITTETSSISDTIYQFGPRPRQLLNTPCFYQVRRSRHLV